MVYGAFNNNTYNGTTPNITAASLAVPAGNTSNFASNTGSLNTTASSRSQNPFGIGTPDLSQADPGTLRRLDISNLIYSPSVGGYITQAESNQGHFAIQGGDPNANRLASQYYAYIGGLPTLQKTSPALAQLNAASGVGPSYGPSYNSFLSNFFNNSSPYIQNIARNAGFSPTYGGPYKVG